MLIIRDQHRAIAALEDAEATAAEAAAEAQAAQAQAATPGQATEAEAAAAAQAQRPASPGRPPRKRQPANLPRCPARR